MWAALGSCIFNFDHDILVDFDVKFEIFAMSDFWFGKLYFHFWSWYSCWLWCQVWNICYEWLLVWEVVLQQQLIGGRCSGKYLEHSVHTFTSIFCLFFLFFFLTVQASSIGNLVSEWFSAEGFSSLGGVQRPISPQVLTKAWRRHHQCRQCYFLSFLVIHLPQWTGYPLDCYDY